MKTEVKVENSTALLVGNINRLRRSGGEKTKTRPNFEGETVKLDVVCFDCSNVNRANN